MFEIHVGELRATFLRNHNMRRHKDPSGRQPKQKTTQAQKTPATPTVATTATSTGALHPIWGAAPDMGRCTRYVAVHPNRRGALPTDRVHCPNTQEQTRNWHTEPLTAAPLHAQLGPTGGRMGTAPTPPPALRPTPTPPTPLHAKSRLTPPAAPRRNGSEPITRQAGQPAGFSETSARTRLGPSAVARMPRYWGRHAKQPMVRWSCAGVRLRHVMSMSVGVGLAVVMT